MTKTKKMNTEVRFAWNGDDDDDDDDFSTFLVFVIASLLSLDHFTVYNIIFVITAIFIYLLA